MEFHEVIQEHSAFTFRCSKSNKDAEPSERSVK